MWVVPVNCSTTMNKNTDRDSQDANQVTNQSLWLKKGDLERLSKLMTKIEKLIPRKERKTRFPLSFGSKPAPRGGELLERIGRGEIEVVGSAASTCGYPTSVRLSRTATKGLKSIARTHGLSLSGLVRAIAAEEVSLLISYTRKPSTPDERENPDDCRGSDDGDGDNPHPAADTGTAAGGDCC